ncbi:uncharacterized protein TRIADDRAFT_57803 [Trichoplax adhaerens]|uniref:C3H1-type domain-containing protein n=1 Tax=Trichoplax adhaerens TaxID=10228 RepID=B3S1E7_TRIAD|nr:predicted protein [Trichoplax adhaerens]EDV22994.1 predicted protein [Trichoplax adhaerens]|eukprot:XP_002113904.1 predicted protein [Trichoplax adhaerens]
MSKLSGRKVTINHSEPKENYSEPQRKSVFLRLGTYKNLEGHCRYWVKLGHCNLRHNCPFLHDKMHRGKFKQNHQRNEVRDDSSKDKFDADRHVWTSKESSNSRQTHSEYRRSNSQDSSSRQNKRIRRESDSDYYDKEDERRLLKRREEINNELKELSEIQDVDKFDDLSENLSDEGSDNVAPFYEQTGEGLEIEFNNCSEDANFKVTVSNSKSSDTTLHRINDKRQFNNDLVNQQNKVYVDGQEDISDEDNSENMAKLQSSSDITTSRSSVSYDRSMSMKESDPVKNVSYNIDCSSFSPRREPSGPSFSNNDIFSDVSDDDTDGVTDTNASCSSKQDKRSKLLYDDISDEDLDPTTNNDDDQLSTSSEDVVDHTSIGKSPSQRVTMKNSNERLAGNYASKSETIDQYSN